MKQRIEKWWDSFVSLKWWVQAIIIVAITIGVHSYILHQVFMKKKKAKKTGLTQKQKKLPKALQMAILKKQKKGK